MSSLAHSYIDLVLEDHDSTQFIEVQVDGSRVPFRVPEFIVIDDDDVDVDAAADAQDAGDEAECVICRDASNTVLFDPCGHMACADCTDRIMETTGQCHLCRAFIQDFIDM